MIEAEKGSGGDSEEVKKIMADHDKLVEEIFQHEDKDKNGFISHDEFSGPKHDELWSLRAASPRLRAPRRRRVSRHHVFPSKRNRLFDDSRPLREQRHWTRNNSTNRVTSRSIVFSLWIVSSRISSATYSSLSSYIYISPPANEEKNRIYLHLSREGRASDQSEELASSLESWICVRRIEKGRKELAVVQIERTFFL